MERHRAHPILGPILLIALALLLAMTMLHAVEDGHATEVGALCLAVITVIGLVVLILVRALAPAPCVAVRGDRGPPSPVRVITIECVRLPPLLAFPLRR